MKRNESLQYRSHLKEVLAAALLAGMAALSATGARATEQVTYVDGVDCGAGACEVRRKTEPLERLVFERHARGICVEYTRRIAGLRKVPSRDPATPLEIPQYEDSRPRHVSCEKAAAPEAARLAGLPSLSRP